MDGRLEPEAVTIMMILSLSPGNIARIGSFLDFESRRACVLTAKVFHHVHENFVFQEISFTAATQAKFGSIERTIAYLLDYKPNLA